MKYEITEQALNFIKSCILKAKQLPYSIEEIEVAFLQIKPVEVPAEETNTQKPNNKKKVPAKDAKK